MSTTLRGIRRLRSQSDGTVALEELEPADSVDPPAARTIRLGHLSDLHYGKPLEEETVPEVAARWLEAFDEMEVDAVVYSGDLVETPDDRVGMLRMRHLFEEADSPWVAVPGNHDVGRPGADSPFYELFGKYPRVERLAGVEFVLLDSFGAYPVRERTPLDRLDAQTTGAYSKGRVGDEQLRAARERLGDGDRPRVLVLHHHLAPEDDILDDPPESSAPDALMVPCLDRDDVLEWARDVGVRAVFHGHMHAHWPPYAPAGDPPIFNSGSSSRGKPERRARLVDLGPDGGAVVWELAMERGG